MNPACKPSRGRFRQEHEPDGTGRCINCGKHVRDPHTVAYDLTPAARVRVLPPETTTAKALDDRPVFDQTGGYRGQ